MDVTEYEIDRAIELCLSGQHSEFRVVVDVYYPRLLKVAMLTLQDSNEADDVTQDTFARVWERLHQFKAGTNFRAWVNRIHANIIIDRRRRRRFWTTPWESVHSNLDLFQPESPDSAIAVDRDQLVTDLLRRLTDRDRQIVVLRYFEEMSIREIAEAMSMKEGTVKSQLHRTLRRMRDTLSARFTFSDLPIEDN